MEFHFLLFSCLLCSLGSAAARSLSQKEEVCEHASAGMTHSQAFLQTDTIAVIAKQVRTIPKQLICTGKPEAFEELSKAERANIQHTLSLNHGLKLKYLGDRACYEYLRKHFKDSPLVGYYKTEPMGMYRGDICRTAVLAHEGGYYTDLDVALELPFSKLVDSTISFASVACAREGGHEVLNAVMIAAPGHPIMKQTLVKMVDWYAAGSQRSYLGTLATKEALLDFTSKACPQETISSFLYATTCGRGKIRMIEEKLCDGMPDGCPQERVHSEWTRYGLYDENGKRYGWSRFAECEDLSCGGTGRSTAALVEVDATTYFSSHRSQMLRAASER